jgi:cytochrome c oxidase subunit 2
MRSKLKKDNFDYVLLCNKICGNAHYTMKMKIVVDTPEEFAAWLKTQKKASEIPAANAAEVKVADAAPTNIKPAANL